MDLMSGKTSYAMLKKKYSDMRAPTIRITAGGVELTQKLGCGITDLAIELSCGYEASGCSFTVLHEYEPEKTMFRPNGAVKYLQIGAPIEVAVGYIVTETVFSGYISEVEYTWDEGHTPEIRCSCTDAKCLMMKSQRMEIVKEQKLSQTITAVLNERPASAFLKGSKVDKQTLKDEIIRLPLESDYNFLVRYAQYTGSEFFILQGKAYFREKPASTPPIMTLSLGRGMYSAQASMRSNALIKQVQVNGIDPETGKAINGKAAIKGKFSKGPTASRVMEGTTKFYFDENIINAQQATARAATLMEDQQKDFMVLRANCMGIPELVPGRYVKIKGLAPELEKSWYIQQVRHTVDDRGFRTSIVARMDSL